MKIRAIVLTTQSTPTTPILEDAWDEATALINPAAVRQSLADAFMDPDTLQAAVVAIEVPDDVLLPLLTRAVPTVQGELTDEKQS